MAKNKPYMSQNLAYLLSEFYNASKKSICFITKNDSESKLLLNELKVDRIEIASARVSDGEFNAVKEITSWGLQNDCSDRIEVLTFVDNGSSINWMKKAGSKVQNLLMLRMFILMHKH